VAEHVLGRLARCPRCQTVFGICRACDRGHVYCGPSCSELARRDSLRRARRRHRQSPEGRLDHRDRERARRRRRREARRVGDHASPHGRLPARLLASTEEAPPDAPLSSHAPSPRHCVVCRFSLRFAPFARGVSRNAAPVRATPAP